MGNVIESSLKISRLDRLCVVPEFEPSYKLHVQAQLV
jgi:hypothetical protein